MKALFLILFLNILLPAQKDSLAVVSDTTLADTSRALKKKAVADTLKPIYYSPSDFTAYTISNSTILTTDYRDAGDILNLAPFSFIRRLGTPSQPDEINLYGYGLGSVSYLQNGIEMNNRLLNTYDINYILTEDADSIQVSNIVRGFFESEMNNPVAVNLIAREDAVPVPYSRVKYYEGPFDEALVDFRFAQLAYKKFGINFDLKNSKAENSYEATEGGVWTGRVSVKYYMSDKINFAIGYNYSQADQSLNGGVDYDSIKTLYSPSLWDEVLYDNISAPVKYRSRYVKKMNEALRFQGLFRYGSGSLAEFNIYSMRGLDEFRQNEKASNAVTDNSGYHSGGFEASNTLVMKFVDVYASLQYEKNVMTRFNVEDDNYISNFKASVKGKFTGAFTPAVFIKMHNIDNASYFGAGADLSLASGNYRFYAGASYYERAGERDPLYYEVFNLETSVKYLSEYIKAGATFFVSSKTRVGTLPVVMPVFLNGAYTGYTIANKEKENYGVAVEMSVKYRYITSEAGFSLINSPESGFSKGIVPKYNASLGVYYTDILFDSSLALKTGLKIRGFSSFLNTSYDHFYQRIYPAAGEIPSGLTVDFFTAGRIQEVAYAYFAWENIFDRRYYLMEYYPMYRRGIRFGLAWEFLN